MNTGERILGRIETMLGKVEERLGKAFKDDHLREHGQKLQADARAHVECHRHTDDKSCCEKAKTDTKN